MKLPCIQLALALTATLFLGSCASEPSLLTGKTGYYGYTWEQELAIGKQADAETVRDMGLYQDDAISEYVKQLGDELLAHSTMRSPTAPEMYRNTPFTFRVLDSPIVNAFALPGGYVYVTRGLLAHVENEAQLAVVIGHEITHVEARHASQQALKQQWGQLGLAAGAIIGEQVAENKELARSIVGASSDLFQLVTLKYGRDAERESDLHGVEYAAKSGYDTAEASRFFSSLKRISERSGQSIPSWMSTHPDPGEREQTIERLSQNWKQTLEMSEIDREAYLRRIDGLVVGEDPRNGYIDGLVFYHPDMRFQFSPPAGWRTQNQRNAVYSLDPTGTAIIGLSIAKEKTARDAATALSQSLALQISATQDSPINGLPAVQIEGLAQTSSGNMPVSAAFIEHMGNVFTFLGYGTPEGYAVNRSAMLAGIRSFAELTNPAILNVQPNRLEVSPAERSAPFRELLPSKLPPGMDAQAWAIINQVDLEQRIERGTLLKRPVQRM